MCISKINFGSNFKYHFDQDRLIGPVEYTSYSLGVIQNILILMYNCRGLANSQSWRFLHFPFSLLSSTMKSGLIIFTLAVVLLPTPSDARNCTLDELSQINDSGALFVNPDVVKCEQEQLAMGIIKADLDSLLKNKEEYCKLESCKNKDMLGVQFYENTPTCSIPGRSGDSFAVAEFKGADPKLDGYVAD